MKRILHQVKYEQLVFWRNRSGVFFTFALPMMLLLLLGLFISGDAGAVDYSEFLVPGIAAMGIASVAFQALAIAISYHRELGILKTLAATPMSPGELLAAKVISVAVVTVLEVAAIVSTGSLVFSMPLPQDPLLFAGWALIGIVSMAALGVGIAQLIPSGESAPAVTNAVYLPVVFVSGVFYSVERLPEWGQVAAAVLPLHHLVEPIRSSYLGEGSTAQWAVHLAVLAAWTLAGAVVATRRFRWEPRYATG